MDENSVVQEHLSGETCPGCDREVVLLAGEGDLDLHLACDCGEWLVLPAGPLADVA